MHDREQEPILSPAGFREYDVRWLFPTQINRLGITRFGHALGHFYRQKDYLNVIVGHDWRAYSPTVKQALIIGLLQAGCHVHDIGLSLSPMAYFAQQALNIACLAMVTASHNENGWTGIKMSHQAPLTLLPDDIQALRALALSPEPIPRGYCGKYTFVPGLRARYLEDLTQGIKLNHPFKVVVGCGNGTAGHFVPEALEAIGAQVIRRHCNLDATFPHYNPNPEDMRMLRDVAACVREHHADIGLAFDGDGDRCGAIGPDGCEIFADKMGVLLGRHLLAKKPGSTLVVDVKSTHLYQDDPHLRQLGARIVYWKTGHSYIKEKMLELGAIAGFEKSGHAFLAPPFGRGYDDGIRLAIEILRMLDAAHPRNLSDLYATLTPTWLSPTLSPPCPDDEKYAVVERLKQVLCAQDTILGQPVAQVLTLNGIRLTLEDGTWGLIRASSNTPNLVVVAESRHSHTRMMEMLAYLQNLLEQEPSVNTLNLAQLA